MGEDFLRRRNRRFMRQRDAYFWAQLEPDLFSACPPQTVIDLCGTALRDVDVMQELWAPPVDNWGPIQFFSGDVPVVQLDTAAANYLRSEQCDSLAPVVAQVVQVERDHRLVMLRVGSVV